MIDLEIALAKAVSWSLYDIERTDVESLMLFVHRLTSKQRLEAAPGSPRRAKKAYIDQAAGWL